jgi:lysophospholipase L1-like esterase
MHLQKSGNAVVLVGLFLLFLAGPAAADESLALQRGPQVRYMALGDSLVAGQGAFPATRGYVYLLYYSGVFGSLFDTTLNNGGVSGATSEQVLKYQVPQAIEAFQPTVMTLTLGGNDLLSVLKGANLAEVLARYQANLTEVLRRLRLDLPGSRIYLSNLYAIPEIAASGQVVPIFNQIVAGVAAQFGVPVVDVYSAFAGKEGLIQRGDIHPTNAGYQVMAEAFGEVIRQNR